MNASDWIAVIGLLAGGGGAGAGIAKLTRLAVAVENFSEKIAKVAGDIASTGAQVQDHENRLNRAKL